MIILASKSPRRKELLEQIGWQFVVADSLAEELTGELPPQELVVENARRKATTIALQHPEALVIGADTVVALKGKIFGKPHNRQMAKEMLVSLSGQEHSVFTGVAVSYWGQFLSKDVETKVTFAALTEKDIEDYLNSGEPFGKAGAYAIQGRGAVFVTKISGSYSNVVGLPLYELNCLAKQLCYPF